jgi:hypothetical protein
MERTEQPMKFLLSSTLALAIAGLPLRVQEPDDKGKPQQEEPVKQPDRKAKQQPEEKPKPKPEKPKPEQAPPPKSQKPEEKQQPDEKERKEQEKRQKEQTKKEKNRPSEQTTSEAGGNKPQTSKKGQRIPPEKFHATFGREHRFKVAARPDERRFQYGGYWFEVVEVWPAGWSFDDECYLEDDGDDYYLVDFVHPEMRVLVIVVTG